MLRKQSTGLDSGVHIVCRQLFQSLGFKSCPLFDKCRTHERNTVVAQLHLDAQRNSGVLRKCRANLRVRIVQDDASCLRADGFAGSHATPDNGVVVLGKLLNDGLRSAGIICQCHKHFGCFILFKKFFQDAAGSIRVGGEKECEAGRSLPRREHAQGLRRNVAAAVSLQRLLHIRFYLFL